MLAGINCGRPDLSATVMAATIPATATKVKKQTATLNCHLFSFINSDHASPTARNAL